MIHPADCDCGSYACELRAKGVQTNAGAATSHRRGRPGSNAEYNGWERGFAGETRADGSFMPYTHGDGTPIRNKEFAENRHTFTERRRRQLSGATTARGGN